MSRRIARPELAILGALLAVCVADEPIAAQVHYPVIFDSDFSPRAAVVSVLTLQRGLSAIEDRIVPSKPFAENTFARRVLGLAYRSGKWVLLDLPQDGLAAAVNHEVFGHGFRFREFGLRGIEYSLDAPTPYGAGGGSAGYAPPDVPLEPYQLLAIDIGGMEAENVAGQALAIRAFARGTIHYSESNSYITNVIDGLGYVLSAFDTTVVSGDDVADFLVELNAATRDVASPLRARSLKNRAVITLANPMLAYAAYGLFVSHLGGGRPMSRIPTVRLAGGVRYLPLFRFQMAPYGTEWISDHFFARGTSVLTLAIRRGDARTMRTWGAEVQAVNLGVTRRITMNAAAELWRQPVLEEIRAGSRPRAHTGGLATATLMLRALNSDGDTRGASVYLQGGLKSAGFVAGERLSKGAILRAGLAIHER